ncbi:MAG: cyclase family protein [Candidatus Dadabacteria bacterium]|nr:cyclase family protein [Candidatus Dadabacteria bacterium]
MQTRSPKQSAGKKNLTLGSEDWIDITVPLSDGMVHWPGDPPVKVFRLRDMGKGDDFNMTALSMSVHTATHLDAPSHFTKLKTGIDKMPLSAVVGNARVIEIEDKELIKEEELRAHRIRKGERILFKTRNSKRKWGKKPFDENFVHLSTDAAKYLVERQVQTIGVDYLSIGGYEGNVVEVHHIIRNASIWVIEGLDLSQVEPGDYELICLPIKIENCEGAPARALLRPV